MTFKRVPDSIRETFRSTTRRSRYNEEITAVMDGQTIFLPGVKPKDGTPQNVRTLVSLRSSGKLSLVTRQAYVDGESGLVMWTVPKADR